MSRKPRPLKRDGDSFRDDRLFIVACDDTYAPKQYFGFFQIPRIKVHVVPTDDHTSSAQYVLERLCTYDHDEDDELWMLLDTDHCTTGSHLKGFTRALKEAKEKGVKIALSKPCFELWLLLHYINEGCVGSLSDANETENALRETLGEYDKKQLKKDHYPLISVREACLRAEKLDKRVDGGEIPSNNTSRVYQLWKSIASQALPGQLPDELKNL